MKVSAHVLQLIGYSLSCNVVAAIADPELSANTHSELFEMVTCKVDSAVVPKMNRARKTSSSNSSGFRLLDGDQLDTVSSVSRNSIYKIKIDAMFDDTR